MCDDWWTEFNQELWSNNKSITWLIWRGVWCHVSWLGIMALSSVDVFWSNRKSVKVWKTNKTSLDSVMLRDWGVVESQCDVLQCVKSFCDSDPERHTRWTEGFVRDWKPSRTYYWDGQRVVVDAWMQLVTERLLQFIQRTLRKTRRQWTPHPTL